jgi:hypothetical protein
VPSQQAQPTPQPPSQPQHTSQPQQNLVGQGQRDLIDFGQTDSSVPAQYIPARGPSLQQQTMQQAPNATAGLQEPLMPGHPVKRVDSLTKDLDEFVDAPGN